jgi:hypothetical protein
MAPPLPGGTIYYPPPPIESEGLEAMPQAYEEGLEENQFQASSAHQALEAEQAHSDGGESALPAQPAPSPAAKVGGSKMRAKAPKWVPKSATNATTAAAASDTKSLTEETAAS